MIRSTLVMPWVRPPSSSGVIPRTVAAQASSAATSCSVGPVMVQVASAGLAWSISSQVPVRSRTSFAIASSVSVRTPATAFLTIAVNARGAITSHGPTGAVPSKASGGSAASTAASTTRTWSSVSPVHSSATVVALARSNLPAARACTTRGIDPHNRSAVPIHTPARCNDSPVTPATSRTAASSRSASVNVVDPSTLFHTPEPSRCWCRRRTSRAVTHTSRRSFASFAHRSNVRVRRPRTRNATRPSVSMPEL